MTYGLTIDLILLFSCQWPKHTHILNTQNDALSTKKDEVFTSIDPFFTIFSHSWPIIMRHTTIYIHHCIDVVLHLGILGFNTLRLANWHTCMKGYLNHRKIFFVMKNNHFYHKILIVLQKSSISHFKPKVCLSSKTQCSC